MSGGMSDKTYFDMGRGSFRDEFDIIPIGPVPENIGRFRDFSWYLIAGFADRGAHWNVTYHRPSDWTDEDWEEFCNEMEEDVRGGDSD